MEDHAMEDNAMEEAGAHEDDEHSVSMKAQLDFQKHTQTPESTPKNEVHATKVFPLNESPGDDGFLTAAEPPTPAISLHSASESETNAQCLAGTSFTQQIDAIETQSPIDQSSIPMPPLDADSMPTMKLPAQNFGLVGKTAKSIRNGEAGRTTFSAFDLPLPKCQGKRKNQPGAL